MKAAHVFAQWEHKWHKAHHEEVAGKLELAAVCLWKPFYTRLSVSFPYSGAFTGPHEFVDQMADYLLRIQIVIPRIF